VTFLNFFNFVLFECSCLGKIDLSICVGCEKDRMRRPVIN
jgi:hypothetical protein